MPNTPRIVALDYYDGLKEGFGRDLLGHAACYFKVVAWDQEREFRIFSVVSIDCDDLIYMIGELSKTQTVPQFDVWIAKWVFDNKAAKNGMSELLDRCREKARAPQRLCLAPAMGGKVIIDIPINDALVSKVNMAFYTDRPDDIDEWLPAPVPDR
jgi:hypothetical protein